MVLVAREGRLYRGCTGAWWARSRPVVGHWMVNPRFQKASSGAMGKEPEGDPGSAPAEWGSGKAVGSLFF